MKEYEDEAFVTKLGWFLFLGEMSILLWVFFYDNIIRFLAWLSDCV